MSQTQSTFELPGRVTCDPVIPMLAPLNKTNLDSCIPVIHELSGLTYEKLAEVLACDRSSIQKAQANRQLTRTVAGNLMAISYIGTYGAFVDELKLAPAPFGSPASIALAMRLLSSSWMLRPGYVVATLPPEAIVWKSNIEEVASANGLYVEYPSDNTIAIKTLDVFG